MLDISTGLLDVGARLRLERERLGLNLAEMGAIGGVNRNSQSEYELGKRPFTIAYLLAVSGAGVDFTFIITGCRATGALDEGRSRWLAAYDQLAVEELAAIWGMIEVMLARRGPPATIHTPGREFKPQA